MSATMQQLLQPDAGTDLPPAVRQALIDMGIACNDAAVAVNQAYALQLQTLAAMEAHQARQQQQHSLTTFVAEDLVRSADNFHAQLVVVYARTTAIYAGYASQVATDVAGRKTPRIPGSEVIRPSDLVHALDIYLPQVRFTAEHGEQKVVDEQNADIAQTRKTLVDLVTHQLQGEAMSSYDDPADVTWGSSGSPELLVGFPEALHVYAATLVWAFSVFTGIADEASGIGSPGTT